MHKMLKDYLGMWVTWQSTSLNTEETSRTASPRPQGQRFRMKSSISISVSLRELLLILVFWNGNEWWWMMMMMMIMKCQDVVNGLISSRHSVNVLWRSRILAGTDLPDPAMLQCWTDQAVIDSVIPDQLAFSDKSCVNIPTPHSLTVSYPGLQSCILGLLSMLYIIRISFCCSCSSSFEAILHTFMHKRHTEHIGIHVMDSGKDSPLWTGRDV